MKNIKLLLTFFAIGFLVFSCREDHTDPVYNGDSYLHFNFDKSRNEFVKIGTASKDVQITYGTIKPVTGTHQVKLVVDQTKSTAVEGVDFQILNPTDELTNGETGGTFNVRMMEPSNSQVTKVVVFKLESATIKNAVFDTEYTLSWKLQCLVGDFLGANGTFNYAGFWNGTGQYLIEPVPNVPNMLRIIDYPEIGTNFQFSYNDEGVVTFETQNTGYIYPSAPYAGQVVQIRPATLPSTIDMCSRILTLNASFILTPANVGWPNRVEKFTGF
ncbi:MAG: hypothetical protein K0M63_01735 [Weeksellaceae bacterium]|nr:hypothetical protein [Weeksellaceae bacterium]